jgi:hypothetical protein
MTAHVVVDHRSPHALLAWNLFYNRLWDSHQGSGCAMQANKFGGIPLPQGFSGQTAKKWETSLTAQSSKKPME